MPSVRQLCCWGLSENKVVMFLLRVGVELRGNRSGYSLTGPWCLVGIGSERRCKMSFAGVNGHVNIVAGDTLDQGRPNGRYLCVYIQ